MGWTSGYLLYTLSPHFLLPFPYHWLTSSLLSLLYQTPFESVLSPIGIGCSPLPSAVTTVGFGQHFEENKRAKKPRESC